MAKTNVFLLSFVLFVSLSSLSHGLTISGLPINSLQVQGVLRCTLTGDLNAPPVSGQTVFLTCGGSRTNLGQAVTNPAGLFTILIKIADTSLFDPSTCLVTLKLPVATCSAFPPDGVLTASIGFVNVVQTNVGNIANYVVRNFVRSL